MQDMEYMDTVLEHGWWVLEMDSAAPLHYPKVQLIIVAWMSGFLINSSAGQGAGEGHQEDPV